MDLETTTRCATVARFTGMLGVASSSSSSLSSSSTHSSSMYSGNRSLTTMGVLRDNYNPYRARS
jgi:hypothetical protein